VLLGQGEQLLAGIGLPALGYERTEHATSPLATHVVISKRRFNQPAPNPKPQTLRSPAARSDNM